MGGHNADKLLAAAIRAVAVGDGPSAGPVPGSSCVRYSSTSQFQNQLWRASLAIVAQGTKELVLGRTTYALSPGHYTLTPLSLPLISRVARATAHAPFLCLLIRIDPMMLSRVVADMDDRPEASDGLHRGVFVGEVCEHMRDAAVRLTALFESSEAGTVLGPGYVRELLFYVLRGPNGSALRQFVHANSEAQRISQAVHRIESDLTTQLDIAAMAAAAGVSRTVFFEQFKRVTSLSPVQYQKRQRLLEAQRLMVEERTTAEDAAYRVGYQSPSQFSREYARMFGEPPLRHATRLRDSRAPLSNDTAS